MEKKPHFDELLIFFIIFASHYSMAVFAKHVETTKRYARLADRNVRTSVVRKESVAVRAYSVGWLHFSY